MQITLSRYAGFCDGVRRAYDIVKKISRDPKVKKPIFVLGSLVHNQDVVNEIEKMGIKKIDFHGKFGEIFNGKNGKIGTLIITAHGMGPEIYKLAEKHGVNIVDATCPRVIKVQMLAKAFINRSCQIVVLGDKDHKEVKGISEWADKKTFFVDNEGELRKLKLDPGRKIAVVSQTTQDVDFTKRAADFFRKNYDQVEIADTICLATQNRQEEVKKMAKDNKVIIIIGSPDSANSTRLWEIARQNNSRSYFIERVRDIDEEWFVNCDKVGVTAGASTPDWIIEEVVGYLKKVK